MTGLRALTGDDLELVLAWRNRPDVRANMFTTHEISLDEHRAWFAKVSADPSRRLFLYEEGAAPLGVVTFTDLAPAHGTAQWGFYAATGAPRGTGTRMLSAALAEAFGPLALAKVWAEVLAFNAASQALHVKLGFALEGTFRAHRVHEGARVDVLRYGLTREAWRGPT